VDRYRWLATFLAIVFVAVLGSFGLARGAAALTLPLAGPPAPSGAIEAEEEDEAEADDLAGEEEDEEEVADDCEFEDEAQEEACEEAEEERELEEEEAEECRLESAEATVAALPGRNQVRLTVRYKTFEPSAVAIDLGLRGPKGSLDLGTDTGHFTRAGAFHATESLSDQQMTRALAAREFTVEMHAINTPGFCGDNFERHLSARREAGAGFQWSDPTASRRAKASRAGGAR
jgi:hypothetical protein